MADYGSVAGVQKFIAHMTIDGTSKPNTTEVGEQIDYREAELNLALASGDYATPVTGVDATVCGGKVNLIVAFDIYGTSFDGDVPANIAEAPREWRDFLALVRSGNAKFAQGLPATENNPGFLIAGSPMRDKHFSQRNTTNRDWD